MYTGVIINYIKDENLMQLYWTKQNKYYKLIEQRTLFGTIDVVCVWGRIGGNLGGYKIIPCATKKEVDQIIDQVSTRRKYRGYNTSCII